MSTVVPCAVPNFHCTISADPVASNVELGSNVIAMMRLMWAFHDLSCFFSDQSYCLISWLHNPISINWMDSNKNNTTLYCNALQTYSYITCNAIHIPSKCSCLLRYHIFLNQYPPLLLASDWSDLYLIMPQYMIKAVLLSLAAYMFI